MGGLQRDGVAELVPEHGFPIDSLSPVGGRADGRNHPAKTDPEESRIVRHAKGADSEILLLGKDFHDGRPDDHNAVFFT